MMPHTELVYPATRHDAVNVRMVEQMSGCAVPKVVDGDGMVESARLLKPHHLVVCLQSEHRVLEKRQAATVLLQECRQIVVDVCLCELLRQLLEKQ